MSNPHIGPLGLISSRLRRSLVVGSASTSGVTLKTAPLSCFHARSPSSSVVSVPSRARRSTTALKTADWSAVTKYRRCMCDTAYSARRAVFVRISDRSTRRSVSAPRGSCASASSYFPSAYSRRASSCDSARSLVGPSSSSTAS